MAQRPQGWTSGIGRAALALGLLLCLDAHAQVRLPNVQVPQLPGVQLPNPIDTLDAATGALDPNRLRDLRRLRIRELLRTNRRELEADPNGAPIIREQIVAYAATDAGLQIATQQGFTVVRESTLSGINMRVVILRPPSNVSTRAALRRLRRADPSGSYDFNHIYIESGAIGEHGDSASAPSHTTSETNDSQVKVGLIDTGIDRHHPSLAHATVEEFGCGEKTVAAAHGTAVASLLVGHAEHFFGAAPDAKLYAADVYCGKPTGGSIEDIAVAFSWLAEKNVPVINVSLVGPANGLLEKVVQVMLARGHIIVAAVGNDGPAAPPLYPASYSGVIGVTGVDSKRRVLVEAARGKQVYFAAPGADMGAAALDEQYVAVRGTSFAAPIVAGLLARNLLQVDAARARQAIDILNAQAIDLGSRGIDKVYGHGLVGESLRTDAKTLVAKK